MKLELTAKEIKSIGTQRAMKTIDTKYIPWLYLAMGVVLGGLIGLLFMDATAGVYFILSGYLIALVVCVRALWDGHTEGYKFLDLVMKGDNKTEEEQ